jgi:hypothetical protein
MAECLEFRRVVSSCGILSSAKFFLLSDKSTGLPCERIVDYEGAKVCVYKKTKGAGKGKGQDLF